MSNIKSTIAVHARYHAFRLAEGLSALGALDKIYTLNPRFKIASYKIKPEEIKSFWYLGALKYANLKFRLGFSDQKITNMFDARVARTLVRPGDNWIFTSYSGYSEKSLKKAKELGAIVCVERSCPHIDFQEELVREERSLLLGKEIPLTKNEVSERMKREYEIADYIITPSNYSKKSFIEKGFSARKVIITPLCGEKDVVLNQYPRKYPDEFVVLGICGHFYRKGLYYLLRAWQELNLKNARLIVRGDVPSELGYLKSIKNVEFITHHMPDAEMVSLYRQASMFVLPSVDEGFGMVVVEAMGAALPVLITENVGAADIIENGREGFVVPIRSVDALKEKITLFYENRDQIGLMGSAAFETAKNYTKEKYAERVLNAYKMMLDAGK